MKKDAHTMLKELIALDIRQIPNTDFTTDTIAKIKLSKLERARPTYSLDSPFLLALCLFVLVFFGFFLLQMSNLILPFNSENNLVPISNLLSNLLFSPTSIAITLSFSILHYLDVYLQKRKKKSAKFANPTHG